eukprot:PITA_13854
MALITELVETKPSYFEEAVDKLVWIDEMVEEYKSIVMNNVWEAVLRLRGKLVMGFRWIFKVNNSADGSIKNDERLIRSYKEDLAREFEMKDTGLIHYFLRLEVWQGDGELIVSQGKYPNEILHRFFMENFKPMETPLATNRGKEDATSSEEVDSTIYR